MYAVSESSELSVAVPKYFFPIAWAAAFKPVAEGPLGEVGEVGGGEVGDVGGGGGGAELA